MEFKPSRRPSATSASAEANRPDYAGSGRGYAQSYSSAGTRGSASSYKSVGSRGTVPSSGSASARDSASSHSNGSARAYSYNSANTRKPASSYSAGNTRGATSSSDYASARGGASSYNSTGTRGSTNSYGNNTRTSAYTNKSANTRNASPSRGATGSAYSAATRNGAYRGSAVSNYDSNHSGKSDHSGNGNGQPPRNNKRGARSGRPEPGAVVAFVVVALLLLTGVIYVGVNWITSSFNASTYLKNVYVNDIDLNSYKQQEGLDYLRSLVDQQLSATYTLSWEDASWSFSAADFDASIDVDAAMARAWNFGHVGSIFERSAAVRSLKREPIYIETQLTYNADKLDAFIDAIADQLYIAPQDAEVMADLQNPVLLASSTPGRELDKDTTRLQILGLIETGDGTNILPVLSVDPALTTDEAMGTLNLIVEYKTDTTARGYNGRFNIRKGLSYFQGMVVHPGEEISFNDVVGPRTKERGWQPGTEYIGGGKSQEGYGGGICQASTTLYGALVKAGMTILARSCHSMTVSYVEPSMDAAVVDTGSKDLRFRNDTEYPITIYTEVTKEYAVVRIYGMRPAYRYELKSVLVSEDKTAMRATYIDDTEGRYCTFTDETSLYSKGHPACKSEGWRIAYDWDTGQEVERLQLSNDSYTSGYDIYWRGVTDRATGKRKGETEEE